jgi:hypothetical protein
MAAGHTPSMYHKEEANYVNDFMSCLRELTFDITYEILLLHSRASDMCRGGRTLVQHHG